MRYICLGSGNADLHADRAGAGHLLLTPDPVILDMGPGTWRNLARAEIDPAAIRVVLLSHLHADHFSDLVPLLFHQSWHPRGKGRPPLAIFGPPGTKAVLETLRRTIPHLSKHDFPIEIRDILRGEVEFGAVRARPTPVPHVDELAALAWRVEAGGGVFGYSGDCRDPASLAAPLRDAALAVVEATCPGDGPLASHLTAAQAAEAARDAGVRRLVLAHLSKAWDGRDPAAECAGIFAGPVEAARDLLAADV